MHTARTFNCAFLIRSLGTGGTERQLVELARGLRSSGVRVTVITFYPGGAFQPMLVRSGVKVVSVNKKGRWDIAGFLRRLVKLIRAERPDVLYSFLPSANIVAALTRHCSRHLVVWGVRASRLDLSSYDWLVRVELLLCVLCSRLADTIVCNSRAGFEHHAAQGYPVRKMQVVSNGIDCSVFKFDAVARATVRAEWNARDDDLVVGLVARVDAIKGHADFLAAGALLARDVPRLRFVCVGGGPPEISASLRDMALDLGLADRVTWAGERTDVPSIYSALDVFVSASHSEGFSNSIAEAMACERVCVVTDVGDSASLVAASGRVVPSRAPDALAAAIKEISSLSLSDRMQLGCAARQRIEKLFSVSRMVDETARLIGVPQSQVAGVSAATAAD